ncbi:MAG: ornithine carbamoyltransferase [Gammaproteobacteria bacterium]|nr:ornithine carbamoyltransferase [Gammaproteobacteria bacterium]MCI0591034.1 ornithine carbamoyltransferase [Gammaproteobacteria bacterium]
MTVRHFLRLTDVSSEQLAELIRRAIELKTMQREGTLYQPLVNRVLAMIFEKSSTRTRVSFETAMLQLGGGAIFLSSDDTQLGRGELLEDTARVLSRMVECIVIRTFEHAKLERFAEYSQVPVINGLSDTYHPCQLLADMQTYYEHRGPIRGKTVAWVGDGNNMCHSYINASLQFDFQLNIACPKGYEPTSDFLTEASGHVQLFEDPSEAVRDADLVATDTWTSMGQEEETEERSQAFGAYQVNGALMSLAKSDALFMHCLPAHRGKEVTADILDGPHSVVWDQSENRLHSQKALLEFLMAR